MISSFLKVSGLTLYSPLGDWNPKNAVKANLPFRVGDVGVSHVRRRGDIIEFRIGESIEPVIEVGGVLHLIVKPDPGGPAESDFVEFGKGMRDDKGGIGLFGSGADREGIFMEEGGSQGANFKNKREGAVTQKGSLFRLPLNWLGGAGKGDKRDYSPPSSRWPGPRL